MAAAAAAEISGAELAECREQQELEIEALKAIFPTEEDHGDEAGAAGSAADHHQGGTRLLACTQEGDGWRLALGVKVAMPCPDTGVDVVVVAGVEQGEQHVPAAAAAPATATASEQQQEQEPEAGQDTCGSPQSPSPSPADGGPLCLRAVKYLPPLRLDLHLGPSYPLHSAPTFALWAPWLDPAMAAWAAEEIGKMWTEVYAGGPVVFSWVDWLGRELLEGLLALSCVGAEEACGDGESACPRLVLRAPVPPRPTTMMVAVAGGAAAGAEEEGEGNDDDGDGDGRGGDEGGGGWAPRLLMRLLAFTYARESEAFARGAHTCYICFESQAGTAFATLRCGHFWCRGCLGEMARTHVRDGDLAMLVCPHPECGLELPPEVMKELLPPEGFERWEQLLLSKALDGMGDVAYCPRDQTPCIVDGLLGECPSCHFAFCARCKEAYHGRAAECFSGEARLKQVEAEIQRILDKGGRLTATQNEKLEKLRRAAEESLSRKVVEKGSRACPKCAMRVEKTEGCNKMRCRCGVLWCWTCGKDISEESYGHFREGASNCGLWEREALLAWQQQMAQMEVGRGIQGEMVRLVNWGRWGAPEEGAWARRRRGARQQRDDGIHIVRCGKCGGQHVKLGSNNHIRCSACRAQFCALCGASNFRKASEHFGPGGCKQHS